MKILVLCIFLATLDQCAGHAYSFNDVSQQDLLKEILGDAIETNKGACNCVKYTCSCCKLVHVEELGLNDTVCFHGSYLPDEYGVSWSITIDGKSYLHGKVSVKNPPPVCLAIPYPKLKKLASLCIRFTNLTLHGHTLHGCVDLEAKLVFTIVEKINLGCFTVPPKESGQNPSTKRHPTSDQKKEQSLDLTSKKGKVMSAKEEAIMLARMGIMGKKFMNGRLVNVVGI